MRTKSTHEWRAGAASADAPGASALTPGETPGAGPLESHESRVFLGVPVHRIVSLLWAAPFLLFLVYPMAEGFQSPPSTRVAAIIALSVALSGVYIVIWLVNDATPVSQRLTTTLVVWLALLLGLQVALTALIDHGGGWGGVYTLCYVASPVVFLLPRRTLFPGLGVLLAIAIVETLVWPQEGLVPLGVVTVTTIFSMTGRQASDRQRMREVEAQQALALSQERERTRISADLHDILGQSLTGISVKLDLTGRLLDAGRVEEARAQIDEVTDLTRTALADVRAVVAANRTLLPATEIDSARTLLGAAGVRLEVIRQGEPAPGTPSTLVAHVIREATTNALKHASPSLVLVTLRPNGVRVVNDGVGRGRLSDVLSPRRPASEFAASGSGLAGLADRVAGRGRLTWGPEGDSWVLDLVLDG
ncbi:histidine kinase [Schaalia sp. 19OD2882]|uniref:sensor histidine kinase n=1 Tax=Schaalia sp. 19OD2882 TaxID=2794089 RepID=UPI001C1ED6ED|nr:histidine kinase [Schaalia sp. 19OD2882]QWW19700.1 histidine kinase [Schaalia sp. 19OD2882]